MTRKRFSLSALVVVAIGAALAGLLGSGSGGASVARLAASPPVNATLPVLSGVARQNEALSASAGSWGGLTPITFAFSWQRCDAQASNCVAIAGATGQTYTLTASDVGRTLRVAVTASNSDGSAQVLSEPSGTVASIGSAPANTRQPDPIGIAQEGQSLHADEGSWNGTAPITFAYQWERGTAQNTGFTKIAGATSRSYHLTSADVGFKLRVQVTATNAAGQGSALSNLTDVVVARGAVPVITTLPVISGDPLLGHTLTASSGSWTGASGSFSYQWGRGDTSGNHFSDIHGASGQTYTLGSADIGWTIRVSVRASNPAGSAWASSAPLLVPSSVTPGDTIDLGGGLKSVPVSSLVARPDHLLISQIQLSPTPFAIRNGVFTARFRVISEGSNNVVRGAHVNVVGIPYGWIDQPGELTTGTDGWVTFQIRTTSQMQLKHGGALVMQVRARAPGKTTSELLGGISTRRLIQLNLTAPR